MQRLGATVHADQSCTFNVWAPSARHVEVVLPGDGRVASMEPRADGYFTARVPNVPPGTAYQFRLNRELERSDPASRLQSDGVHGPSRVVDLAHEWKDIGWRGVPLSSYVIYELHVGTFSREGTFEGIIPELRRLKELGVTAIELMPVAQFPGARNWGYDGVYPFAVQDSYGGPKGLQRLVDECHRAGLAVVLDVVYNHLGPEGNYLGDFGPYFTDRYRTPWGKALNYDGEESEGVRRYFLQNALDWFEHFHIDALRLDAVHAIIDRSAKPFLEELADAVHGLGERLGRHLYLIAESDLNDPRMVRPSEIGGMGLDAMWCDDFHHAVHALITGEKSGYYADYGRVEDLAQAFRSAMVKPGEYSEFRKRRHGRPGPDLKAQNCVVCIQNHDQIGNRLLGERLGTLVGFEERKLAAGLVCLSRFIPLLFMGEEYGEEAPFQYFVDHGDEALLEAIRKGRREEFASFAWGGQAPDPGSPETLERSLVDPEQRHERPNSALYQLYTELLHLRGRLTSPDPDECIPYESRRALFVQRGQTAWLAFSFSTDAQKLTVPVRPGRYRRLVSSADKRWQGPGANQPEEIESNGEVTIELPPHSFVCYAAVEDAA